MRLFDPGPPTAAPTRRSERRDDPAGPGTELLTGDGSVVVWRRWLENSEEVRGRLLDEVPLGRRTIRVAGREVLQPRLDAWLGDPDAVYTYSGVEVRPRPWTPTTVELRRLVSTHCGQEFNSVLLNYYRDGADSMGEHADDEPELGTSPTIASLSLGGTRRMRFRHRVDRTSLAIDLDDGDLLVMSGATQRWWRHGIAKTAAPAAPRLNLTYRLVVGRRQPSAARTDHGHRAGPAPAR